MSRVRKAYAIYLDGHDGRDIVYAPTPAKAKAQVMLDLTDCGWTAGEAFRAMRAVRSPANDVTLPDEHRLVADLSPEERRIVLHAFGADGGLPHRPKEGYRDHYCTAPSDRRLLRLAWELGLFSGPHGERAYGDTGMFVGAFFYLTDLGRQVARSMLPTYRL